MNLCKYWYDDIGNMWYKIEELSDYLIYYAINTTYNDLKNDKYFAYHTQLHILISKCTEMIDIKDLKKDNFSTGKIYSYVLNAYAERIKKIL